MGMEERMGEPEKGAFPLTENDHHGGSWGLTKREYFAGQAMAGLCADPGWISSRAQTPSGTATIAKIAVLAADALLAELAKEGGAS